MGALIDLTGRRFGRLTVLRRAASHGSQVHWVCACDCGATVSAQGGNLKCGATTSCGCAQRQSARDRFTQHGASRTRLYMAWKGMISRCSNPNHKSYALLVELWK